MTEYKKRKECSREPTLTDVCTSNLKIIQRHIPDHDLLINHQLTTSLGIAFTVNFTNWPSFCLRVMGYSSNTQIIVQKYRIHLTGKVSQIRTFLFADSPLFNQVRELTIENGHSTQENKDNKSVLEVLPKMKNLHKIYIQHMGGLDGGFIGEALRWSNVEIIQIDICSELKNLNFLENHQRLKRLSLGCCERLEHIGALGSCLNLTELYLIDSHECVDLSALRFCSLLRTVHLDGFSKLVNIDFLSSCPLLETLYLQASNLKDVNILSGLSRLRSLELGDCLVEDWGSSCSSLEYFTLTGCPNLLKIDSLRLCRKLKEVKFSDTEIDDLSPLSECDALVSLTLDLEYEPVGKIERLLKSAVKLNRISRLSLTNNTQIDLSCLEVCPNIQKLSVYAFNDDVDLSPLSQCSKLRKLTISRCQGVHSLLPLKDCPALKLLNLFGVDHLQKDVKFLCNLLTIQN